jgi:Fur family ferric uptake transcriptional regulator
VKSEQRERNDPASEVVRWRAVLREHGVKCTAARLEILRTLDGATEGHLSARQIHRRITEAGGQLDLSTAYRTLERLMELGLVHVLAGRGEEMVYGLSAGAHHHAVCDHCGAVADVQVDGFAETVGDVVRQVGFRLDSLVLRGRCSACQAS